MNVDSGFPDPELEKLLAEEEATNRNLFSVTPGQSKDASSSSERKVVSSKPHKRSQVDNTNFGPEEIRNRFGQHTPTDNTKEMHEAVHGLVTDVATIFDRLLPNGRAKFQALVELEKALMWANAAISDMEPLVEQ